MKNLFKNLNILLLLCALALSTNAWGITSTGDQSTLCDNFNSGTHSSSWSTTHVTFKLAGTNSSIYTFGDYLYMANGRTGLVPRNEGASYTLSWTVEEGFDIKVTKVTFKTQRASGMNSYITIEGNKSGNLYEFKEQTFSSGTLAKTNNQTVSIVFGKATSWSTVAVNSITVTYTLKPKFAATNGSVEVTICLENKQLLDLTSVCHPVSAHVTDHSYKIISASGASVGSAHIAGDNKFYATSVGTYTLRDTTVYKGCHNANYADFTVTVTPAVLTLVAPTASDIAVGQALSASTLTGGSASTACGEVAGSWTWTNSSLVLPLGDGQAASVTFTPSSNAGNYSNFVTNTTINVKGYVFLGTIDTEWNKAGNWNVGSTPSASDDVIIRNAAEVNGEEYVHGITIDGGSITINPTGGLTVGAGGISGATTSNLTLKASQSGENKGETGYLRVDPSASMPEATVELFSIGYKAELFHADTRATWQYVGSPLVGGEAAKPIFKNSYIYNWIDSTGVWENNRKTLTLQPFEGYATTQYKEANGMLTTFAGQLADNKTKIIPLAYDVKSAYPGCNMVANSFTAPIDITKLDVSDFSDGVEATIYIFNTGSSYQVTKGAAGAGQYTEIPVEEIKRMAKGFSLPTVIPAMQGFLIKTSKAGSLTMDYSRVIMDDEDRHSNTPLHVKRNNQETEDYFGTLRVSIEANEWRDFLYMLESDDYVADYENGRDTHKMMGGIVNVFAIEGEEALGVDATNSFIGTRVGVRTGEETVYTLSFSHLNSEQELALWDKEMDQTIEITEETEYTFFAEPNSIITDRFQIVERDGANKPGVTTDIDNVENGTKAYKFIKDNQLYILKNGVLYNATGVLVR